jgi:hypothetical protein
VIEALGVGVGVKKARGFHSFVCGRYGTDTASQRERRALIGFGVRVVAPLITQKCRIHDGRISRLFAPL